MATTKKSVSKPTTKRTVAKKAPARKPTVVRTVKKANHANTQLSHGVKYESFKASKGPNFFSTRITDQTIYWAILGFIVLALGVWIVTINDKIQYLYDQIDQQNPNTDSIVIPKKR